jgi:hypothetical protein
LNNGTNVFVQQLATLMRWHILYHMTTWFSSILSNSRWDSICFVVAQWWHSFFIKTMNDKLLEQRHNIKFLVKLKKNATDIHKMLQQDYEKGTSRSQVSV